VRVVALGAGAAVAGSALLAASGWLVTRAAERPPVLALLAAIVVVRALGLVRAFGRYGERIAAHDAAFRRLAEVRVAWYRRLVGGAAASRPPTDAAPSERATADPPSLAAEPADADAAASAMGGTSVAARGASAPGAADLLSRFVVDVDELQHREVRVRWPVAVALVAGVAATGFAVAILPAAGAVLGGGLLVAATVVPGVAWLAARGALRRQGAARAALVDELVEALDAAPQLALAGRTRERLARLDAASAGLARIGRRDALAAAVAQGLGALVSGATLVGVLLVAAGPAADGALEPVWLGALALLALGAFEAVGALPEAAVRAVSVAAAERRLEAAAPAGAAADAAATGAGDGAAATGAGDGGAATGTWAGGAATAARDGAAATEARDGGAATEARDGDGANRTGGAPLLTARGIRHRPGGPRSAVVLDGADLTLRAGERVAVIGASGAGKTVLVELLAGLAEPDEGAIERGGSGPPHEQVRLAGQDAHLFATSIANNVRIGAPGASDQAVAAALRATGLGPWLDALPDGIDTLVGEEGFAVSGGQRQRIALARCLVSTAPLLLLDEPTAMLDPPAARAFLTDLDRAAGDRGVLVVTHERVGLEAFDRVLELRDGRLHAIPQR